MGSSWFPFQYRDATGWRADGLPLTAHGSAEGAKMLDAAVAQMALMHADPQVGGAEEALAKADKADPDLFLLRVFKCSMEAMATDTVKHPEVVKKVYDLKKASEKLDISQWERDHLDAVVSQAENDLISASVIWERILVEHPKDMLALQSLFFTHLTTGRRRGLRDCAVRVAEHHRPGDRYYGNVYAKMCFGYEQNQQFDMAARCGMRSLEATPRDIWAVHSMSHVHEETERPTTGVRFLEERESDWADNPTLDRHVWWHRALHHVAKGEHEEALSLYDGKVKPLAFKMKFPFPLSDATALLLRLEMEGRPLPSLELKDRWRELAQAYAELESANNVFYDFHLLVACLYGDDASKARALSDSVKEQASLYLNGTNRKSYNCRVAAVVGVPLVDAVEAFRAGDHDSAVEALLPVRYEVKEMLGGSNAQKDVVDQLLIRAALGAGRKQLAKQLLSERMACRLGRQTEQQENGDGAEKRPLLNDRILETIMKMH